MQLLAAILGIDIFAFLVVSVGFAVCAYYFWRGRLCRSRGHVKYE